MCFWLNREVGQRAPAQEGDAESRQPHKVAWKWCFCRGERIRTGEEHLQLEYLELGRDVSAPQGWAAGGGHASHRCLYRAGLRGMEQPTDFHSSNPLASPEFVKARDFPMWLLQRQRPRKTRSDARASSQRLPWASFSAALLPRARPVPGAGWRHRFGVSHDLINRHCD